MPSKGCENTEVLDPGQAGPEGGRLDQRPDAPEVGGGIVEARAEHGCGAGRRGDEAEQHRHGGRLAGAVRTDEPGHDPGRNLEREAVDRRSAAVALRELIGYQRWGPFGGGDGGPSVVQRRSLNALNGVHAATVGRRAPAPKRPQGGTRRPPAGGRGIPPGEDSAAPAPRYARLEVTDASRPMSPSWSRREALRDAALAVAVFAASVAVLAARGDSGDARSLDALGVLL